MSWSTVEHYLQSWLCQWSHWNTAGKCIHWRRSFIHQRLYYLSYWLTVVAFVHTFVFSALDYLCTVFTLFECIFENFYLINRLQSLKLDCCWFSCLMMGLIQTAVLYFLTPHSDVIMYGCFRGKFCLLFEGGRNWVRVDSTLCQNWKDCNLVHLYCCHLSLSLSFWISVSHVFICINVWWESSVLLLLCFKEGVCNNYTEWELRL